MGQLAVTPEELSGAGTAVTRGAEPLSTATTAVAGTSGAAQGTPAAGAYATLLADAAASLSSLQTAVTGLGGGLTQAASNYETAERANRYGYGGPR